MPPGHQGMERSAVANAIGKRELPAAVAAADKARAPIYRDALIDEFTAGHGKLTHDDIVMRNRAVTAGRP
jgi:hypothetical protein